MRSLLANGLFSSSEYFIDALLVGEGIPLFASERGMTGSRSSLVWSAEAVYNVVACIIFSD